MSSPIEPDRKPSAPSVPKEEERPDQGLSDEELEDVAGGSDTAPAWAPPPPPPLPPVIL